jgi:hypothetical protein
MPEPDFEAARDPVEIGRQQLVREIPRRLALGPRHAGFLVGANQHSLAFLAHVDLALEVDGVQYLLRRRDDFGDLAGDEVLVLHRQNRQRKANEAPDLARPEPGRVDDVLRHEIALVGDHVPRTIGALLQIRDAREAIDFGAEVARGFCIRLRDSGGIDVAFERVVQRADEVPLVHQREDPRGLVDRDDLHVEAEVAGACTGELQEIHPLPSSREVHSRCNVDAARLAGRILDFAVELDRILLQLGDVRIAIQRVHASGRMPCRAGRQLVALDQHDVGPAGPREVVQNGGADDAATDDGDSGVGLHYRTCSRNARVRFFCESDIADAPSGR